MDTTAPAKSSVRKGEQPGRQFSKIGRTSPQCGFQHGRSNTPNGSIHAKSRNKQSNVCLSQSREQAMDNGTSRATRNRRVSNRKPHRDPAPRKAGTKAMQAQEQPKTSGLSHADRRERRRQMAEACKTINLWEVARTFYVSVNTVRDACKENGIAPMDTQPKFN